MGFEITNKPAEKMYSGMIISYLVRPLFGIPMGWVTEIKHVEYMKYFVDEQRVGPYTIWHHEHHIEPIEGGVLMHDIVSYLPPLGILGRIANYLFIEDKLKEIFDFRYQAVIREFGDYKEK